MKTSKLMFLTLFYVRKIFNYIKKLKQKFLHMFVYPMIIFFTYAYSLSLSTIKLFSIVFLIIKLQKIKFNSRIYIIYKMTYTRSIKNILIITFKENLLQN